MIIGRYNKTAIGTLVEHTSGYVMLLHLPKGYRPEQVRDALAEKIYTLPQVLRGSLTWDQGPEMRDWQDVRVAAEIDIYFCDPHAPPEESRCSPAACEEERPERRQAPGYDPRTPRETTLGHDGRSAQPQAVPTLGCREQCSHVATTARIRRSLIETVTELSAPTGARPFSRYRPGEPGACGPVW